MSRLTSSFFFSLFSWLSDVTITTTRRSTRQESPLSGMPRGYCGSSLSWGEKSPIRSECFLRSERFAIAAVRGSCIYTRIEGEEISFSTSSDKQTRAHVVDCMHVSMHAGTHRVIVRASEFFLPRKPPHQPPPPCCCIHCQRERKKETERFLASLLFYALHASEEAFCHPPTRTRRTCREV